LRRSIADGATLPVEGTRKSPQESHTGSVFRCLADSIGGAVCHSPGEIDPALQGGGATTDEAARAVANPGVDCRAQSTVARMGGTLQARPCPKAFPLTRRMDCETHLVASIQTLAHGWLELAAGDEALRRVWVGQLDSINPFDCLSPTGRLRESCIRENHPSSLSGGQRPAPRRASSDPTQSECHGREDRCLTMYSGAHTELVLPIRRTWNLHLSSVAMCASQAHVPWVQFRIGGRSGPDPDSLGICRADSSKNGWASPQGLHIRREVFSF
jgi:hypothetical protein